MRPEAEHALADLLHDFAVALDPEHPERVVIGPVDFGQSETASNGEATTSDDGTIGPHGAR